MSTNRKSLKASYFEAFLNSFVVGLAENFFAAFSLHLGMSTLQTGLLISMPLMFSAFFQFFFQSTSHSSNASLALFGRAIRQKNVTQSVLQSTLIQALSLLSLAIWSFSSNPTKITDSINSNTISFLGLLCLFSVYWFGHFSIQPAWNRWISEFVPTLKSQQFFSTRTWLNQIGIITGLLVGGFGLHLNYFQIPIANLFTLLFLLSFICKLGALFFFNKHEQAMTVLNLSFEKLKIVFNKHSRFYKSYTLFHFSVYFSAPFVAGYLLGVRELRYLEFTTVMMSLFIGKIATSIFLKMRKKQFDPTVLMFIGGAVAAPLPIMWPIADSVHLMVATHFISGMAWALWEVGLSLCFFQNIPADEKMETVSVYNYLGVASQVIGTLFGAALVKFVFSNSYEFLFYLAGVCRFLAVFPLKKFGLQVSSNKLT